VSSAIRKYVQFHQRDPKRVGRFHRDLEIPDTITCVGVAKNVLYRSDKLNPETSEDEGWIDYIHKHDRGVYCYLTERGLEAEGGRLARVPAWVHGVSELVWLGQCLGFEFAPLEGGGPIKVFGKAPLPELYCSPSGKALYVIQSKRRLLAMMWGGRLGVEPRGIVH
jgi:hypothetical protein